MLTRPELFRSGLCAAIVIALLYLASASRAADVAERVSSAADSAKASIEETGSAAADKIGQIWKRIDERRLVNRTPDEIVAWVIMGVLVGAVAGLFSIMRTSAIQRFWALGLGLIGAFIGGIVAHVAQLDFGLGPVMIRYEDLLLSLVGGLLLIVVVRFIAARRKGKV
jgi:uncharacterized membrane protein YeaQ/YmgE (transglycosylase-associated protein family)